MAGVLYWLNMMLVGAEGLVPALTIKPLTQLGILGIVLNKQFLFIRGNFISVFRCICICP
jgi:hypothetical protein